MKLKRSPTHFFDVWGFIIIVILYPFIPSDVIPILSAGINKRFQKL